MALKSGALLAIVGSQKNVRECTENVRTQLDPMQCKTYSVDVWTPATPEMKPYKFQRSQLCIITIQEVKFSVCAFFCLLVFAQW